MANGQHLRVVRQGPDAIQSWRARHPSSRLELNDAQLEDAALQGADLRSSKLRGASLVDANLEGAVLSGADLSGAWLMGANLRGADLTGAHLGEVRFSWADLTGANLSGAELANAVLEETILVDANLDGAFVDSTVFARTQLSPGRLIGIVHAGPSSLDHGTIERSGMLPVEFLRGCGLPDHLIGHYAATYDRPIKTYSCFISYSTRQQALASRLHADLDARGIRNWLATEDLKIGDRFRQVIHDQIRLHDKLLLVLSRDSIASPWVEREVLSALELEDRTRRSVLFPISVDRAFETASVQWAAEVRASRHVGDFRGWGRPTAYAAAFDRLLRDLRA